MSDDYTWHRERAEGFFQKLNRVAFLAGYYGKRAECTGNVDLAALATELSQLVHGPVPEVTTVDPVVSEEWS
jgi:hypothetical protein